MLLLIITGVCFGFISTLSILTLLACYINGIPLTKPYAFGLEIYLTITRYNQYRKQSSNQFRITPTIARNACNFDDLSKKPYINILPLTTPSMKFKCLDNIIYSRKIKEEKVRKTKKVSAKDRVTRLRQKMRNTRNVLYASSNTLTHIKYDEITDSKIKCHWISYDIPLTSKSIQESKGIIVGIHGGAYIAGTPVMHHSIASLLSKLTGFVVLSIDYGLSPEFTMKSKVREIMKCYEYLLSEMRINPKNIFLFGESAGGGLSLLFVQALLNKDKDKMCGGCIMYSPWCNIAGNTPSYKDNANIDAMIVFDTDIVLPKMASCYMDKNGDICEEHKDKDLLQFVTDPEISSMNGTLNDKNMCSLYLMIGASELLLDDSLNVAEKAYNNGIDVTLDISPYLFHTWPIFANFYDEAVFSIVKTAYFINKRVV